MHRSLVKFSLFFVTCFLLVLPACKKKEEVANQPIRVGEFLSLTGSLATYGIATRNGVELALDEANQAGGIGGRKIETIVLDDQGKPEEAATVVTKLITQDKVDILIGEVASSLSLAAAPIAQAQGVPMISPSSTNPKVTEVGDYIFRVCFIDPFQGQVMAKFAASHLKAKKAAVLRDIKNDYSIGLADFFVKEFKGLGGQIVADQSYSQGDVDFKAQLTQIRAAKPDILFIPGYYTEVGLIARQSREIGIAVPLLGGDGWDSNKLTEIGGKAIVGGYFSNHYSSSDERAEIQVFVQQYKARYGEVPDGLAAMGYDAGKVLVDALRRVKNLDRKALRDALASTKDLPGVSGKITIDDKRNAVKPAVVLRVAEGGKYEYVTTVLPN